MEEADEKAAAEAARQVLVSSVAELTAAVGNSAVDMILVAAGTYDLTSNMCTRTMNVGAPGLHRPWAICIDRALTIEAQVPGSAVLDAKGGRGVFLISSGANAKLIGLDIIGGFMDQVSNHAKRGAARRDCVASWAKSNPRPHAYACNVPRSPHWFVLTVGGVLWQGNVSFCA